MTDSTTPDNNTVANTNQGWRDLVNEGRIEDAIIQYQLSNDLDESALYGLKTLAGALSSLREKSWSKAHRSIEQLDERAPIIDWSALETDLEVLKIAGEALDNREPEQAFALLEPLNNTMLISEIETLKGTAHIFMNHNNEAKLAFEKAIAQDPKHYRALTNLGNLALESGQTDEAIVLYEQALKLNDDFTNALHNLGVAYRKKGQIGKSVRQLRKAQTAGQQKLREDARESLRSGMNPQTKKFLKWGFYGIVALVTYAILRGLGIL